MNILQNRLPKVLHLISQVLFCLKKFVYTSIIDLKISPLYFDSIPPVPEISNRIFDSARLKEMRKRIDSATDGDSESEIVAAECMEYIAEISSGKKTPI